MTWIRSFKPELVSLILSRDPSPRRAEPRSSIAAGLYDGRRGFVGKLPRTGQPRSLPEGSGNLQGVDADPFPPSAFVAGAVQFAMMRSAQRHSELVADLATECPDLGEGQVMRVHG